MPDALVILAVWVNGAMIGGVLTAVYWRYQSQRPRPIATRQSSGYLKIHLNRPAVLTREPRGKDILE